MDIVRQMIQGTYDLTLSGKFTFSDHTEFRSVLDTIAEDEVQKIVLHMAGVEFVDSAALGMLLLARDVAEKHHKHITIEGPTGQVKKMFEMARFSTLFTMS